MSPSHSPSIPLVPPGFSSIPTHSPKTSIYVPHPSTSSKPISIQPQISESTPSGASISIPVDTHLMQTRSKFGIHNPRLHPSLFLTHSKPKTMKQALENADSLAAMQQEYDALLKKRKC